MATRVQVILQPAERDALMRRARREHLSLSAWMRRAALDRAAADDAASAWTSAEELRGFFARCDALELGDEPSWEEHRQVIEASRRQGRTDT